MSSHFATSHNASASTSLLSAGGSSGGSVAQVVMKATAVAATKPYVFSSFSFPSLPVQTESVITRWLYKHADTSIKAAHGCGLLSPLWLWTHACYTESQRLERSSTKAVHLAQWLSRNLVERRHIAIVCPHPSMVRQVAEDLKSAKCDVVVLLPNDIPSALRRKHGATEAAGSLAADATEGAAGSDNSSTTTSSSVHTTYHHIIYLLPEVPNPQTIKTMTSLQEQCLSAAMSAATTSCTIIADATWLLDSVKGRWKGWGAMVDKLALQSLQHEGTSVVHIPGRDDLAVPGNPAEGHGRGLMGPKLPVCCGAHHDQFTFYSGLQSDLYPCSTTTSNTSSSQHHHNNDSSSSVVTFCKRLCLHLHQCRRPEHMCSSTCHRAADHRACPFACNNVLPCGHPCKMECAERCNCLVVTRERLPCSHQIVVGLDPETQLALYATIPHEFHGFCVDRGGPCVVEVPSTCATCLGPLTAPCHVLQQAGHTMEQRTVSCPSCQQAERDIRSNALAEVLVDTEQRKREMKVDLARTVHEQRKGAASGIFRIGARVVIRHSSKAIAPIDPEADFPNVPFVDYDADDFTAALTGSMGIIVSQHVDVDDPAELRSLVRLSTGKYVLVGDGGMEFIRADVSAAVSGGGGGGTPLLLLMGPSSGEAKEEQEDEEELKKLSAQRSAMKGKWFIVMTTVRIPASSHMHPDEQPTPATAASSHCSHKGNEEGGNTDDAMNDDGSHSVAGSISSDDESNDLVLNEVVVEVVGDDPQRRGQWVEVQCTLFDRLKETQALEEQLSSPQRPSKRSREEEGGDTDHNAAMDGAHHDIAAAADNDTTMHDAIRVIRFSVRMADLDPLPFALGRDVFITHPQYQVTSAELLAILKDAVKAQLQYKVVAEAAPTITSMLSSTTATTTLNKNAEEVALLLQRLEKQACMWSLTMTPDKSVRVECIINAPRFQPKDMERGLHRVCRGPMCLLSAESGSNNNNNNPTTNRGRVVASYRATEHRGRPAPTRQPATTSTGIALPPPQPPQLMFVPLVYVAADEVTNAMNRMDDEAQTRWATLVQERLQAQFEARALRNDEIAYQQQLAMPPVTEEMALQLSQPHISCPVPLPSKEEVMRLTLRARALPVGDANAVRLLEAKDSAQKKLATMRGKQFHVHLHQQTKDDHDSLAKYMLSVEPKIH